MITRPHALPGWKAALFTVLIALQATAWAQTTPLATVDSFFRLSGTAPDSAAGLFMPQARITTIVYDDNNAPQARSLTVSEFMDDLKRLQASYDIHQEPLVLLHREYGSTARMFCSVYGRFASGNDGDSLLSRSIQSFTLVEFERAWKITHITIQNEHPSLPIPANFWPAELTAKLLRGSMFATEDESYDPDKIYSEAQVDEPPLYPGDGQLYRDLLAAFDTSEEEADGKAPFTIVIEEDGQAYLENVDDLSKAQLEKARSLTGSMLLWYPAIKDKASVKCRKKLYIGA